MILSFRMIHDPSVSHMLHALGDQADGGAPGYYLMAKVWSALFSGSAMSLRMFSTVGFCVGLTFLWLTMRQAFKFFPTAVAFAVIVGDNPIIAFETLDVRYYGLLFALVSLATYLGVLFCRFDRPSRGLLAANVLVNAALVLCHPLGGFYGATIMSAVALSDLLSKPLRIRPWVIASYLAGWLAIFLWFKQYVRNANGNSPHGWAATPGFGSLLLELNLEIELYPLLLFFALLCLIFVLTDRFYSAPAPNPQVRPGNPPHGYLVVGLSLICVLPLFWMLAIVLPTNSTFVARYLVGTLIGWGMVLAFVVTCMLDRITFRSSLILTILVPGFALFALKPLWKEPVARLCGSPRQDPRKALAGIYDRDFGHLDLPIVCPWSLDFLPRHHYAPDAARYYFLLDWQAALAPEAARGAIVEFKILSGIKRNYSDMANVMDATEFLNQHPVFLLQDVSENSDLSHWISLYLKPGAYKITHLEPDRPLSYDQDGEWPLLLVEKQP